MGKISKLMKLLSASAVVAGANSVALANCDFCGEEGHSYDDCRYFDYKEYGLFKGYRLDDMPDKYHLGRLAVNDRKNANQFIHAPKSTTVTFLSDNSDSATAVSESDATETQAALEEMKREEAATKIQNARRAQLARRNKVRAERLEESAETLQNLFDEENARKAEAPYIQAKQERARVRDSEELASMVSKSLSDNREAERNERLSEAQAAHSRAVNAEIARLNEKAARQRDTKELQDMMRNRVAEDLGKSDAVKSKSDVQDLDLRHRGAEEAKDVAYDNRANINISDMEKLRIIGKNLSEADKRREARVARKRQEAKARDSKELQSMMANYRDHDRLSNELEAADLRLKRHNIESERELRKELAQQQKAQQSDGASEIRNINEAATKIQNAARRRLARRKAAELKAEAERQGKIQEHRENAAARKITEALRANKERKEAQRQAQIAGDYELPAEYDAEDRQIRADLLLAEQEQLRENLKAVPVEEAQNGEDFKYGSEEAQINSDAILAAQEQARESLGMNTQDQSRTTAIKEVGVADEEVEKDRWMLPGATRESFRGFDFESNHRGADRWAKQLNKLTVRKIECILWLVSTSYQQLQNANTFAPTAQMAEAISDVNNIFPYSGTNSGVMNVYNAFENTDTVKFVTALERLGTSELDGVLYYVADKYMHLLLSGKKASSPRFVELTRATIEHFGAVWEAENVAIVPDNKDVREAPRNPVDFNAADKGIVETEAQENERWNPPYRVYYAYCDDIPEDFLPTPRSLAYHENPELFKSDLRNLAIRRMEVLIYLANGIYKDGLKNGASPVSGEFAKFVEDVDNVFPKQGEPNARVMNVYNAFKNLLDKPNDNEVSMQPFQKGFRALNPNEKMTALGDIAVAYREMLRNGKRPASLTFVKWADEICKVLRLDGFVNGRDTKPLPEFSEFENEAKAAVAPNLGDNVTDTADDDEHEAADNSPYNAPEEFAGSFSSYGSGHGIERFQKTVSNLTVRQQEALIYKTVSVYVEKLGANRVCDLSPDLDRTIRAVCNRFQVYKGDRLMNVLRASKHANEFEGELRGMFESAPEGAFRWVEKVLLAIVQEYAHKLDNGAKPADKVFTDLVDCVLEVFGLKGEELEVGEEANPAAHEDNREEQRFNTNFWQLPMYLNNEMDDGWEWYDSDEWKEKMAYLNIRQLEVLLVEFANVYKHYGFRGRMRNKMDAVAEAYSHLDLAGGDSVQVAEFRLAMQKARGKDAFESDDGGQASAGRHYIHEALDIMIGEYLHKLETALPVTPEFERAVRGM